MDIQGYLSKLDSLKDNFSTLIPVTNYATTHEQQCNKFFMIMTIIGFPPELDFIRNQILLGSIVHDYESVSE